MEITKKHISEKRKIELQNSLNKSKDLLESRSKSANASEVRQIQNPIDYAERVLGQGFEESI